MWNLIPRLPRRAPIKPARAWFWVYKDANGCTLRVAAETEETPVMGRSWGLPSKQLLNVDAEGWPVR
ncbi:hypothetical protein J7E49_06815 [Variovorax paradoxus]|nr:hypothetical protein [Variovorax paradoxus]